jgi:hypothetical protein
MSSYRPGCSIAQSINSTTDIFRGEDGRMNDFPFKQNERQSAIDE